MDDEGNLIDLHTDHEVTEENSCFALSANVDHLYLNNTKVTLNQSNHFENEDCHFSQDFNKLQLLTTEASDCGCTNTIPSPKDCKNEVNKTHLINSDSKSHWTKLFNQVTEKELQGYSIAKLKDVIIHLSAFVKKISWELGPLLEERNSLHEEIDARNIVIEQLLKLTWKHAELEPRPIQMSVILPSDEDESSCEGSESVLNS